MRPHVRLHTRHRSVLIKLLRISVISFVLNTSCNNQYTGITPYEVRSVWWPISATWFRQVLRDFGDSDPYFHPCGPLLRPWCSTSNPVQWHELWDHRIEAFDTLFSKKKEKLLTFSQLISSGGGSKIDPDHLIGLRWNQSVAWSEPSIHASNGLDRLLWGSCAGCTVLLASWDRVFALLMSTSPLHLIKGALCTMILIWGALCPERQS